MRAYIENGGERQQVDELHVTTSALVLDRVKQYQEKLSNFVGPNFPDDLRSQGIAMTVTTVAHELGDILNVQPQ